MDRSLRFGSRWCNSRARFGLAFATATALALTLLHHANSQAHSSKGTLSPFTRKSSNGLYAHGFRYYFTPLPGYFSPFPHGTCPLSVIEEYLGLTGGPARFTQNSRSSVLLGNTCNVATHLRVRGSHPLRRPLPGDFNFMHGFSLRTTPAEAVTRVPRPHIHNPCRVSHEYGLA